MNVLFTILFITLSLYGNDLQKLTVEVSGIKEAKGKITLSIYTPTNEFLTYDILKRITIDVVKPVTIASIDLPVGEYAIFVMQDINEDGEVNRNFLGVPQEPIGISNNQFGGLSKPDFDECAFNLNGEKNIRIDLVYY